MSVLRVLTWNLYQRPWIISDWLDTPRLPGRRARFLGILEAIEECRADIICVQEAFHGPTRRALARRFPHSFPKLAHRWSLRVHSGLMILSRLPIGGRDGRVFRPGGRGADGWVDKGVMRAELGSFAVFNAHLQSGPFPEIRASQLEQIRDFLASHPGPALLAGDFNLEPTEESFLTPILELGFCDAWPQVHPGESGCTKPDGGQRYDRILVRGLFVREISLRQSRWSDHVGLLAACEIAAEFGPSCI